MYQIIRITGRDGTAKADPEAREHLGCIGEAKMEENCVLFHCRYDRRGGGAAFPYASTYRVTPKRRARRSLAA